MRLASRQVRAIAVDLPGIGGSSGATTDGTKRELAGVVHGVVSALGLRELTLVGHDVGGMIAYSYLRTYNALARAVIADVVVPGLEPWEQVLRNPYLWHFALHTIPALPERLVQGRQREYFDYFFDVLSHDSSRVDSVARAAYVEAYRSEVALTAGFSWYRAFAQDASENQRTASGPPTNTPLLYLRGEHEGGDIEAYLRGFRSAGLTRVEHALVPDAGHFTTEESPEPTWQLIAKFAGL